MWVGSSSLITLTPSVTDAQADQWSRRRKWGRTRFALTYGLGWGALFFGAFWVWDAVTGAPDSLSLFGAVASAVALAVSGFLLWDYREAEFKDHQGKTKAAALAARDVGGGGVAASRTREPV